MRRATGKAKKEWLRAKFALPKVQKVRPVSQARFQEAKKHGEQCGACAINLEEWAVAAQSPALIVQTAGEMRMRELLSDDRQGVLFYL